MYGYMGKVALVDLSTGKIKVDDLDDDLARDFIGGNGFAAKVIYDLVSTNTKAFDEENMVVFATGPVTATPFWGSGRGHMASISPLTGFFFDSNFGGNLATTLKRSGYDYIAITGKASSPVYILIDNGNISINDARDVWGLTTGKAIEHLRAKHGKVEAAVIGPAGEKKVLFASVVCSGLRTSISARGGLGAVLGSKLLKGVVVSGGKRPSVANADGLKEFMRSLSPELKSKIGSLKKHGTPFLVEMINSKGKLVTQNNMFETFHGASKIAAGEIERYKTGNVACNACPIACGKMVRVPSGTFKGMQVKMPEYETLYSMGSMLANTDLVSIFNTNAICDEMGMDTISFGVSLAFLTECVEKGLLPEDKLGGRELRFGDWHDLPDIARQTALRLSPLGELISMGSARLADVIGEDSKEFLYTARSLEIAGHSARGIRTMGLAYATSTRGGSHQDARPIYPEDDPEKDPGFDGAPEYCIKSQHNSTLGDSLVICRFVHERVLGMEIGQRMADLLGHVTGLDRDVAELELVAERIYNLERLIGTKRGLSRDNDTLPYRVMHVPIPDGPSKGRCVPPDRLDGMLDEYYSLRGWDRRGIPTMDKLVELGLVKATSLP